MAHQEVMEQRSDRRNYAPGVLGEPHKGRDTASPCGLFSLPKSAHLAVAPSPDAAMQCLAADLRCPADPLATLCRAARLHPHPMPYSAAAAAVRDCEGEEEEK